MGEDGEREIDDDVRYGGEEERLFCDVFLSSCFAFV